VLSQTIVIPNMYQSLALQMAGVSEVHEEDVQRHFDEFYEDVYDELSNYGELEEMHVCDNLGDHLVGNVYAQYAEELDAKKAVESLNGRFYAGTLSSWTRPLSPRSSLLSLRSRKQQHTRHSHTHAFTHTTTATPRASGNHGAHRDTDTDIATNTRSSCARTTLRARTDPDADADADADTQTGCLEPSERTSTNTSSLAATPLRHSRVSAPFLTPCPRISWYTCT